MTNYERWKLYTKHLHAPKQFLDATFYYIISAALERRVWLSSGASAVYPNQYVLLCGDAGVGKGLALGPASEILNSLRTGPNPTDPYKIPSGPSSGSFEKIIKRMIANTSPVFKWTDPLNGKLRPYSYTCLRIELDEFTSLFTEHAHDAVTYFCQMWTGAMYDRDTHKHGQQVLANPLLNIIGGTTPDNMRKLHKVDVFGTGLDRRFLIVYAHENDRRQFIIPARTVEQETAGEELLTHVDALTRICGPVKFAPEAQAFCEDWWMDEKKCVVNKHRYLDSYNTNKAPHVMKQCMTMHFAEGTPAERLATPISLETAQRAVALLSSYEMLRHNAYEYCADNELAIVADKVCDYLRRHGSMKHSQLFTSFVQLTDERGFDEAMRYCVLSGRVKLNLEGMYEYIAEN